MQVLGLCLMSYRRPSFAKKTRQRTPETDRLHWHRVLRVWPTHGPASNGISTTACKVRDGVIDSNRGRLKLEGVAIYRDVPRGAAGCGVSWRPFRVGLEGNDLKLSTVRITLNEFPDRAFWRREDTGACEPWCERVHAYGECSSSIAQALHRATAPGAFAPRSR